MRELPNPWIPEEPFKLDVERFLAEIDEPSADPSPGYMTALDLSPIVEVLTRYR